MKTLIALALLICSSAALAQTSNLYCGSRGPYTVPAGEQIFCSQSVAVSSTGTCSGNGVDVHSIVMSTTGTWQIKPWEDQDIMIRGVEFTAEGMGPILYAYIGNGNVPDIMIGVGAGETHGRNMFPPGMGMPVPRSSQSTATDYFDLHINCSGGGTVNGSIILYYTPNGPMITAPASGVTWNPSDKAASITLTSGNLVASGSGGVFQSVRATTSRSTGKVHWENRVGTSTGISVVGMADSTMSLSTFPGGGSGNAIGIQTGGNISQTSAFICVGAGTSWGNGDVMAFEVDLDAHKLWASKNGAWIASGNPAAGTNPLCTWTGALTLYPTFASSDSANTGTGRFTGTAFTVPISTGFVAWQ